VGAIDPNTGVYSAPLEMPMGAAPIAIEAVGPGGEVASAALVLQELRFDPGLLQFTQEGESASVDLVESLSDGSERSVWGNPSIALSMENPSSATVSDGGLVTAGATVGIAKLIAVDTVTGSLTGLRVENSGQPSLTIPNVAHGIPGFTRDVVVELRVARTRLAERGVDVSGSARLEYEVSEGAGAVQEPGAPAPELGDIAAYIDVEASRVVFGEVEGTVTFRVRHVDLGVETLFTAERRPLRVVGYGIRNRDQLRDAPEVGEETEEGVYGGTDMLISAQARVLDYQDLVVLLESGTEPDEVWNLEDPEHLLTNTSMKLYKSLVRVSTLNLPITACPLAGITSPSGNRV